MYCTVSGCLRYNAFTGVSIRVPGAAEKKPEGNVTKMFYLWRMGLGCLGDGQCHVLSHMFPITSYFGDLPRRAPWAGQAQTIQGMSAHLFESWSFLMNPLLPAICHFVTKCGGKDVWFRMQMIFPELLHNPSWSLFKMGLMMPRWRVRQGWRLTVES